MADGKEYRVPHRDYIFLPPKTAFVVVSDDAGHVFVLPLLTMTGLSYESESATKTLDQALATENPVPKWSDVLKSERPVVTDEQWEQCLRPE